MSNLRSGGCVFAPHQVWQHYFVEIDHEIFFIVIPSLLVMQEGRSQFSWQNNVNKCWFTALRTKPAQENLLGST